KPMVDFIERKGLSRQLSVLLVFVAILLVIVLAVAFIIPGIQNQFNQLIEEFPKIWDSVISQIEDLLYNEGFTEIYQQFQATDIMNRITDQMSNIFTATIGSIGNVAG